jgi:hypothetical protein
VPVQSSDFVMAGLGVENDSPPNALQPKLPDAVHLRWSFNRVLGFPWYGSTLLRRTHSESKERICVTAGSQAAGAAPAPPPGTTTWLLPQGTFTSDQPLVFTDDFPPPGVSEFDLRSRNYLRFTIQPAYLAHEVYVTIGFRSAPGADAGAVTVTAFLGDVPVATTVVSGGAGTVQTAALAFDAITAVECSGDDAALVELCLVPVTTDARSGWEPCPGFPRPLGLPITHPDYPCTGNAPVDEPAAQARALSRVRYGPPGNWAAPFGDLHGELVNLVAGGPGSTPMADRTLPDASGTLDPPDPGVSAPTLPARRTLDLVMLASLHPAMAQMLGLYWADQSAVPGVHYDYLIIGDYSGTSNGDPFTLIGQAFGGSPDVYGFVVFNLVRSPAAKLPPPAEPRVYALPGAARAVQGGATDDATNSAGLRWDLSRIGPGLLTPGRAITYHIWRAGLGDGDNPGAPGTFDVLTKERPVVPVERTSVTPALTFPDDWPQLSLYYVDAALADGWYAYQINGVDVFGRHSPNSALAAWYEWAPPPDPKPWYYLDPPGDTVVNAAAVRLLAKLPPPPPAAVEAYALDPADTTLVRDAAYQDWFGTLSPAEQASLTGLRVRWLWTGQAARQAPATTEFRIYFKPGRPNAVTGKITSVTAASATVSDVSTDIANSEPADAYAGAVLWLGSTAYQVTGSDAATLLLLHVTNLGRTCTDGTAAVSNGSATVTGSGTSWDAGLAGLTFQVPGSAGTYTVLAVASATELTLTTRYAEADNAAASYTIFAKRPRANLAFNLVIPRVYAAGTATMTAGSSTVTGDGTNWSAALTGQVFRVQNDLTVYRVASAATATQLTLDVAYQGPASGPGFVYEITHPLYTDLSREHAWDERRHVVGYDEHVTVGTDSAGDPLRSYDVLIPGPADADRSGVGLTTSLAQPVSYGQVGVSAADSRAHSPDDPKWSGSPLGDRAGNEGQVGGPATVFVIRREPPPPPVPPPDSERVYATPADYHGQSYYTYRWQPHDHLKTHVFRALDHAVFEADWASQPRAHIDASQLALFPDQAVDPRWNASKRAEVAAELNPLNAFGSDKTGAFAYYTGLSNDSLRVLAGLPGNEKAFTQLTTLALDPADPANANRLGPDNPPDFVVDPSVRAYLDAVDGRGANRYFYRCAYIDAAHNRGPLGLSSPPVWLHKVVPPRSPLLTGALGGQRQATLHWASNREPDLAQYLIYRAASAADARDIRLMSLVHTAAVPPGDPALRPAQSTWTDTGLPGLVTYYYRLVATDTAGNASPPGQAVAVRAHDEALPTVPSLTVAWAAGSPPAHANANWTDAENDTLLERQATINFLWDPVGSWRSPGAHTVTLDIDHTFDWRFRLRVRKYTGATKTGDPVSLNHV